MIVVSHRLSSIAEADRVLVMDAGRIVEVGTPDELLAAGGAFATMFAVQARALGLSVVAGDAAEVAGVSPSPESPR